MYGGGPTFLFGSTSFKFGSLKRSKAKKANKVAVESEFAALSSLSGHQTGSKGVIPSVCFLLRTVIELLDLGYFAIT